MNEQFTIALVDIIRHEPNPVESACAVIGAMGGIITEHSNVEAAVNAFRQFANLLERDDLLAEARRK